MRTSVLPVPGIPALLGVAVLLLIAGCGGSQTKPSTVSGKVSYKGTPLTFGTIEFHGPAGKKSAASIDPDGSFRMVDAPIGENTVVVKVPDSVPKPPPGTPDMPVANVQPVPIPPQYADPARSGVKQTIAAGSSTVTIDLK